MKPITLGYALGIAAPVAAAVVWLMEQLGDKADAAQLVPLQLRVQAQEIAAAATHEILLRVERRVDAIAIRLGVLP